MNNNLEILKYAGDNNVIVHKEHIENFNTKSQLIVNESQEALFYKDGQALDLFKSGRYSLETENLPFFKKLFGKIFNNNTPFACEVFYINKTSVLEVLWGTANPIIVEDPKYHIIIGARANGQIGLRVSDSRKFVVKVVGQLQDFTLDNIKRTIKSMVIANIKDLIAKSIVNNNVSILEISTHLIEISKLVQEKLNVELEDLGLEITKLHINTISCDEGDLAKLRETKDKFLEAMTDIDIEAIKTVKLGEAKAKSRNIQGYTYQDERKFDVLQSAAENEGTSGSLMGAGIGLGMGAGIGAGIGAAATNTAQTLNEQVKPTNGNLICTNCGAKIISGSKFCSECGTPVQTKKFCSECGVQVDSNSKFCSNCGNKLG